MSMDPDSFLNQLVIDNGGHASTTHAGERSGGFTLTMLQGQPACIADLPAFVGLRMWPNPAQDELNMFFTSVRSRAAPVIVIATDGRVVLRDAFNIALGDNSVQLYTQSLSPGLYMMRIVTERRA